MKHIYHIIGKETCRMFCIKSVTTMQHHLQREILYENYQFNVIYIAVLVVITRIKKRYLLSAIQLLYTLGLNKSIKICLTTKQ